MAIQSRSTITQDIMKAQTPSQLFIDTLQSLAQTRIRETPEFQFILAMKQQLLKNKWEPAQAKAIAGSQNVSLPEGATSEELHEMGYQYAELYTVVYNDLVVVGQWDDPIVEAGLLTKQLLESATR